MLTEFAFTPSVFSADSHADADLWREQLRDIGKDMFPRIVECPIIVSDLYGGCWYREARRWVENPKNSDHKAKSLVQGLLTRLHDRLVVRPACSDWPTDDASWAMEAIKSNSALPIDRIVACKSVFENLSREYREVRSLDEASDSGFWHDVSPQRAVPMKIDEQIRALRKMTVYSEFLWLVTPYIYGGGGNDTDFAVALVEAAFLRPEGFMPPRDVVLHTQTPEDEAAIENVASNIRRSVSRILKPTQTVSLVMWPRLLERYVIGGLCRESSKGKQKLSARWGVHMGHIARNVTEDEKTPSTEWSLLNSKRLYDVFRQFEVEIPTTRAFTIRSEH